MPNESERSLERAASFYRLASRDHFSHSSPRKRYSRGHSSPRSHDIVIVPRPINFCVERLKGKRGPCRGSTFSFGSLRAAFESFAINAINERVLRSRAIIVTTLSVTRAWQQNAHRWRTTAVRINEIVVEVFKSRTLDASRPKRDSNTIGFAPVICWWSYEREL